MQRLDTSPWNLSVNLALPLTLAMACGPVVPFDEGDTDTDPTDPTDPTNPSDPSDPTIPTGPTDPTIGPGECSDQVPCSYGYECVDGYCQPNQYCDDGGCCYYGEGGCCYYDDGCCYGEGCWYGDCYVDTDCGPAEYCSDWNECMSATPVLECGLPIAFAGVPVAGLPDGGGFSLAFVEADGDAPRELAIVSSAGIAIADAETAEASLLPPAPSVVAIDVAAGDIDGDGDQDLAITDIGSAPGVLVLLGDGLGGFTPGVSHPLLANRIEIADIDGDAVADLLGTVDVGTGTLQLAVMHGLGELAYDAPYVHSTFGAPLDFAVGELFGTPGAELGAFDGDQVAIWNGGPLDGSTDYGFYGVGGAAGALAFGDFDGDGLGDVARVAISQDWTLVDVFHDDGGSFSYPVTLALPGSFDRAAADDLDGDGRDELVLGGASGSIVALGGAPWDYSAPLGCASVLASGFGGSITQLALGDHDGNGAIDIAASDGSGVVVLGH